ncbi:hypothetical protein QJS66_08815 [Kocuria rhizophila]|nr:hypothetical protein QJS66_08815 [Kocuria rhizophila]
MAKNMHVPFNADGTIAQVQGYHELAELDWESTGTSTATSAAWTSSSRTRGHDQQLAS